MGRAFKKTILNKLNKIFKDVDFYVDEEDFPPHIFKVFYPTKHFTQILVKIILIKIIYKQILIPLEIDPKRKARFILFYF